MTFALIDFTDAPDVLGALMPSEIPEYELDKEWSPSFSGALFYKRLRSMEQENEPTIHAIQARMIAQGVEDPGTGSACCALACYLATDETSKLAKNVKQDTSDDDDLSKRTAEVKLEEGSKKEPVRERHVYGIQQGIEMGRQCTIAVEVDLVVGDDGTKTIVNVSLSGRANFFAKGELLPHP